MKAAIYGKKVGMTQVCDDQGRMVPVTVIDASECVVTQVKKKESDGYSAVQIGYGVKKPQTVNKAKQGHFKKAGTPAKSILGEIALPEESIAHLTAGAPLKVSAFKKGQFIDVTGVSKGRGFAGVMKRHGFKGKDAGHGTHEYFRHGGSAGSNTWPGRIMKNKGMPGHFGNTRTTVQNLEIVDVIEGDNVLLLKGAVPGPNGRVVFVQEAKKILKAAEAAAAPADQA